MYHSKLQLQEKNDNFSDLFAVGSNLFLTDNILLNQATSEFELRGRVTSFSGEFGEILFYITFGGVDGRNQCNA